MVRSVDSKMVAISFSLGVKGYSDRNASRSPGCVGEGSNGSASSVSEKAPPETASAVSDTSLSGRIEGSKPIIEIAMKISPTITAVTREVTMMLVSSAPMFSCDMISDVTKKHVSEMTRPAEAQNSGCFVLGANFWNTNTKKKI